MKKIMALAAVAMALSFCAHGVTYYVSPNGTGDGTTEETPCDLVTGWAKFSGQKTIELVLEDGIYPLTSTLEASLPNCNGISWIIRSKSGDPSTCIIDGQNNVRCFNFRGDLGYYTCRAVIKDLTVRNGKYTTPGGGDGGGAIYIQGTVDHCIVEDSSVVTANLDACGGGVYCLKGTVITNTVIRNCRAEVTSGGNNKACGGGIYTANSGNFYIYDSVISNCTASSVLTANQECGGGAVFTYGNTITAKNVVFKDCVAQNTGNGSYTKGGAIYRRSGACSFENCLITGCSTTGNGGALYQNNGGSATTFRNCTVTNNTGNGTIYTIDTTVVDGCDIVGNASKGDGGGISVAGGKATISNSIVRNNTATGRGAGVFVSDRGTIRNTVIEGNSTSQTGNDSGGGALYFSRGNQMVGGFLVENCVFKGNSTASNSTQGGGGSVVLINYNKYGTNIVFRNCHAYGNSGRALVAVKSNRVTANGLATPTWENGYGTYFINCTMTGNTSDASYSLFVCENNDATKPTMFVRNCDFRNNGGNGDFFTSYHYTGYTDHIDHTMVDVGSRNIDLTTASLANITGSRGRDRGLNESWMDGATDGGDGTYTVEQVGDYGVKVTLNNVRPRINNDIVDIGAQEMKTSHFTVIIR